MKKLVVVLGLTFGLVGCASTQIESATRGAVSGILDATTSSSTTSTAKSVPTIGDTTISTSAKQGRVDVKTHRASRTSRDVGQVMVVEVVANPQGLTKIAYRNSVHLDSGGNLKSHARIYPVSPEGFLIDDDVFFQNGDKKIVNTGKYYVKASASDTKAYATGEVDITRGKTNIIDVVLE
ncbi:hypothetical protein [Motilimonas eburnea]|uniref:hypothetical protein n=1 Tax=Motilimonas eburnea TaxID=1737488 RepID=UPI001E462E02|nr:hypothetical protein [Motilimonas eburnea]MCE2571135.1 hypothetical protein [Motilimonas eburnea]